MISILEWLGEMAVDLAVGPIVIGGIAAAWLASLPMRCRVRRWAVQGVAATDVAGRRLRTTSSDAGGMARAIGHRVAEAAGEIREEWDDAVAEARAAQPAVSGAADPRDPGRESRHDLEASVIAGRKRRRSTGLAARPPAAARREHSGSGRLDRRNGRTPRPAT